MEKLKFIAQKTGISSKEINKFSKFSVLGIIALFMTAVLGCSKSDKVENLPAESISTQEVKKNVDEVKTEYKSVEKSTKIDTADNCGPYPGYPCGTRYFTVAVRDFNGLYI
jgi:hypothetical protein